MPKVSKLSASSSASPFLSSVAGKVDFVILSNSLFGMRIPGSFALGIELAIMILSSTEFEKVFFTEVSDCDRIKFTNWLNKTYSIHLLHEKKIIDAYCAVYRQSHPDKVFFNPLLVLNMLRQEENQHPDSPVFRQIALFIAAKLTHEVSHILHYQCSPSLRGDCFRTTIGKAVEDLVKEKFDNRTRTTIQPVLYNDLGELVERNLFGGLVEAKFSNTDNYMDIEHCAIYPSKGTRYGHYVDCIATIANIISGSSFKFILGDEFYSSKKPSFSRAIRVCGDSSRRDSDAMEDRRDGADEAEDEDDDEVGNHSLGDFRT
jgi:hypothetical protein